MGGFFRPTFPKAKYATRPGKESVLLDAMKYDEFQDHVHGMLRH